jgi:hypothetical protein
MDSLTLICAKTLASLVKENDGVFPEWYYELFAPQQELIEEECYTTQGYGKTWLKNRVCHRDGDKPAVIWSDGSKSWWKEGKRHRDGDEPAVISSSGSKQWYKEGNLHRDGKPAEILSNGCKQWWKEGKFYRNVKPVVIYGDGS